MTTTVWGLNISHDDGCGTFTDVECTLTWFTVRAHWELEAGGGASDGGNGEMLIGALLVADCTPYLDPDLQIRSASRPRTYSSPTATADLP